MQIKPIEKLQTELIFDAEDHLLSKGRVGFMSDGSSLVLFDNI